ncbi:MAG TPA: hypothetical protein VMT61_00155 [Candidatus Binataceae bacterium]|nr:hypothetical protein [Candidatus Binataceae bacterium]
MSANPYVEARREWDERYADLVLVSATGSLPPVAHNPCCVMRKPAQVLYTFDDYMGDSILSLPHAAILRDAIDQRLNVVIAGA